MVAVATFPSDPTEFFKTSFSDLPPTPQNDGPNPLSAIAYADGYALASSYLRSLMAAKEFSERALRTTEIVIQQNPAHYTVWAYRTDIIFKLSGPSRVQEELDWTAALGAKHSKNYQLWHHRQLLLSQQSSPDLKTELGFIDKMLGEDAKNYHVWTYRQWLVRHFKLWDGEWSTIDALLESDVRNNSAWNMRWYVLTQGGMPAIEGEAAEGSYTPTKEDLEKEVDYTLEKIALAPQNPSPWLYLRALHSLSTSPSFASLKETCLRYAPLDKWDVELGIESSHALQLLCEIFETEGGEGKEKAKEGYRLLGERLDAVRKGYWLWRASEL
ncbi:CAAX geranylgeranyltransferase alpha subunit [Saitoella coloradoensis]